MRKATTPKGKRRAAKARPDNKRRAITRRSSAAPMADGENQGATVISYDIARRELGAARRLTIKNGRYTVPPLTAFKLRISETNGSAALDEMIAVAILSDRDIKANGPVEFEFDMTLVARPVLGK